MRTMTPKEREELWLCVWCKASLKEGNGTYCHVCRQKRMDYLEMDFSDWKKNRMVQEKSHVLAMK